MCAVASDVFVNGCPSDEKRIEAIKVCHTILYSQPHRECATRFSCGIIDVFTVSLAAASAG